MNKNILTTIGVISLLICCIGVASAHTLTSITPSTGLNTDTDYVTINNLAGTGFPSSASNLEVNLTRSGFDNITAQNVNVYNGNQITCLFWINGATYGLWNVEVNDTTDSSIASLPNGFRITTVAPTVTKITPNTTQNTGWYDPQIEGTNFLSGAIVNLTRSGYQNITSTILYDSPSYLTRQFDMSTAVPGVWNLVVTNPDGQTAALINGVTITPGPTVTGITPSSGLNTGSVTITNLAGKGFQWGAEVNLTKSGYTNITATSVAVPHTTQIVCNFDLTGAPYGKWNVAVKNPDGHIGTLPDGFTVTLPAPTVSGITPSSGLNTGSVMITDLAGTNFNQTGTTKVNLTRSGYSNITATNVIVVSSVKINCTFPITGAQPGPWNVAVTNPDGQVVINPGLFTINGPNPTITGITPSSGVNTGTVTIVNLAGTGFQDGAQVNLTRVGCPNITNTTLTVISPTRIVCNLPLNDAPRGWYNVVVKNPDNNYGMKATAFKINYPTPTVTGITPSSGANSATVSITSLTGTGFLPGAKVNLTRTGYTNIVGTDVVVALPTLIVCKFPITGKAAGTWNVVVKNVDGQTGSKVNGFTITSLDPSISTITPNKGTPDKNTTVTITGNTFKSGAVVQIIRGSTVKTGTISSLTSTKIVCSLPTKGANRGLWSVKIRNTDGRSVTKPGAFTVTSDPVITAITPNYGAPTQNTRVTITGVNFRSGAVIKITRGTLSRTASISSIAYSKIVCTLPTKYAPGGLWNVNIRNTDGTTFTKTGGFTVRPATSATGNVAEAQNGSVSGIVSGTPVSAPSLAVPSHGSSTLSGGVVVPNSKPLVGPKVPAV